MGEKTQIYVTPKAPGTAVLFRAVPCCFTAGPFWLPGLPTGEEVASAQNEEVWELFFFLAAYILG